MSKTVEVSFLLGAALAGGFKTAFNNAGKLMGDLGQKAEAVSKTAGQIEAYQKLKQGLAANQTAMRDMREKSTLLAQSMKDTSAQTASLKTQFSAARTEEDKTRGALAYSRANYQAASDVVKALNAEMKANPSDELKKKLDDARAEALRLKGVVAQDTEKFKQASAHAKELGKQLRDSTAQEKAMSVESKRLARSSDELRGKLDRDWESLKKLRPALTGAGVDMKNLAAEQARLASQSDRLTAAQNKLKDAQARLAATKQQLSWGNIKGDVLASAGLAMTMKVPVQTAANFEQAMSGVEAVSFAGKAKTDKDKQALEALRNQALELGSTTQFTAMQAAQSQENLARAGFKSDQILAAMPGLLSMAAAEGMDLATAASIASNTLRGFNMDADQSNRVADVLAKTSAMTNTSISGLGEAMKYVAPVAAGLGVSVEQTAALLGAMANAGVDASMGGTALRAAFVRLSKEPKATEKALAALGVATRTVKGEMRTLPSIMDELSKKTAKMGDADKMKHLANIFGTEAASGMLAIMTAVEKGDLKNFEEALKPENVTGVADAMAKARTDNLRGDLTALGSAWEGLNVVIGDVFIPILRVGVKALTDIISKVTELARKFPTLTKVIAGGFGAIAGWKIGSTLFKLSGLLLKLPFQQVSVWLAQMAAKEALTGKAAMILAAKTKLAAIATKAWTAAQWLWNAAMNANPIGLIIASVAALVAAGYYLYKNWDSVCSALSAGWDYVWDKVKAFWNWLTGIFSWSSAAEAWDGTAAHIEEGWDWLKSLFTLESLSGLWDVVLRGWESTKALVSKSWESFKELFSLESLSNLWDASKLVSASGDWAANVWGNLTSAWNTASDAVSTGWQELKAAFLKEGWAGVWDRLKTGWENAKSFVSSGWSDLKNSFIGEWAADVWSKFAPAWEAAQGLVSAGWAKLKGSFIGEWAANVWGNLTSAWNTASDAVSTGWQELKAAFLKEGWAGVWDRLKTGWDVAQSWIVSGWDALKGSFVGEWAANAWAQLQEGWKSAQGLISSAWDVLKNAFLGDWAAGAWDTLTSGAAAAWDTIKSGWNSVADWIGSGLDSAWSGVVGAWDWMMGNDSAAMEKMKDQDAIAAQVKDITMLNKMSEGFADRVAEMSAAWEPFKVSLGSGFNLMFDVMTRVGDIITNNVTPAVNNLVSALSRVASELTSISQAADINVKVNVPSVQTPVNFSSFDRGQGIKAHAAGGIFSSPHVGLVAEDGPEAIVPIKNRSRGTRILMTAAKMMGLSTTPPGASGINALGGEKAPPVRLLPLAPWGRGGWGVRGHAPGVPSIPRPLSQLPIRAQARGERGEALRPTAQMEKDQGWKFPSITGAIGGAFDILNILKPGAFMAHGGEAGDPLSERSQGIPLWMAAGEEMGLRFGGMNTTNYAAGPTTNTHSSANNSYTGGSPTFNITVNGGEPGIEQRIRRVIEDLLRDMRSYEERVAFV